MHNNYYFLRQLSLQLAERITAYTLVSCFSQNKDELVIEFNNAEQSFFLKASLHGDFSCLSFPASFQRAKKNSIDLFNALLLKKVIGVRQVENERSFVIALEDSYALLFKMHGHHANIILFNHDTPTEIFKNSKASDWDLSLSNLDRKIDWSYETFQLYAENPGAIYFTFGKYVWEKLKEEGIKNKTLEDQWAAINRMKESLERPCYYLCSFKHGLMLSLIPLGKVNKEYADPISALNDFFYAYTAITGLEREKIQTIKTISDQIKAGENYITRNQSKLNELVNDHHYQLWADLLMANMHAISPGSEKIILNSFYDDQPVTIKLKKELNAQKNAEVFYRKAKNQQIEIDTLRKSISQKQVELEKLTLALTEIENTTDIKQLRHGREKFKSKPQEKKLPFHEFEFKGFKIWVGKNAESNDELTLKYSYKEDLWLHAKDVAGSHVIIKHQAGKNFPKDVIERAAEIAAYNSKRKTETLCPVAFTPKKFVRKRKGDPAGAVVVEKEEVILVEPRL